MESAVTIGDKTSTRGTMSMADWRILPSSRCTSLSREMVALSDTNALFSSRSIFCPWWGVVGLLVLKSVKDHDLAKGVGG
jgi:hypothetical protein